MALERPAFRPSLLMLGILVAVVLVCISLMEFLAGHFSADGRRRDRAGGGLPRLSVLGEVPAFTLSKSTGGTLSRDDLRGSIWIVDFVFTQCSGTCPQMSRGMAGLQETLRAVPDLRLVSITCDPDNDTAERLEAYARGFGADPQRWVFLRGPLVVVQQLATRALKLDARPATPAEVAQGAERVIHSTRFVLVDRLGRVRGYYDGTDEAAVARLVEDARKLAAER